MGSLRDRTDHPEPEAREATQGQKQWCLLLYFITPVSSVSKVLCLENFEAMVFHGLL